MHESEYTRWAAFEKQVLGKVTDLDKCRPLIIQRQNAVDDDASEGDLVATYIRRRLVDEGQDPDKCCVFLLTAEIGAWLDAALGQKLPLNKVTPYLKALGIPEMRYTKRNGEPGWVWRGRQTSPKQPAIAWSKLRRTP